MASDIIWKSLFVTVLTLARIGQGMYLSVVGPTMLFLAENFEVSVSQLTPMFILRSLGMSLGAVSYSAAMYSGKLVPLWSFGPGTFLLGLMVLITPWINTLTGYFFSGFISGFMFAFVDGAMQTVYLRIWGEEKSRPFIQSLHFGISVGGLLATMIAAPFLAMASEGEDVDPGCPGSSTPTTGANATISTTTTAEPNGIDPVAWSYVIVGGFSILISLPLFAFCACGLEGKIKMQEEMTNEGSHEEPFRDVWPVLALLVCYYFFGDTLEATYANYIYSVSVCSGIGITPSQAANINSLFWLGYLLSRVLAIVYSNYYKPRDIILYGISLLIVSMTFMCIYGKFIPAVMWIVTLYFGFGVGPIYPTGVTWASQVTDISGKYMFVFMFAAGLNSMILLPTAGVIFDKDPFNVMYMLLGAAIAIGLVFAAMEIVGFQHKKRRREAEMFQTPTNNENSTANLTKL